MPQRILAARFSRHAGEVVIIKGWVRHMRVFSAQVAFLIKATWDTT